LDDEVTKIGLSKGVLDHIVARHSEVKAYTNKIFETVQDPDILVKRVRGELKASRFYPDLHVGPKYLVVVYRELHEEKLIITAHFTPDAAKVKGGVIWRKLQ